MPKLYVIADVLHAEQQSEHASLDLAWQELLRLSALPWDESPIQPPCGSWQTCGRDYEIREYQTDGASALCTAVISALKIGADGARWDPDSPYADQST